MKLTKNLGQGLSSCYLISWLASFGLVGAIPAWACVEAPPTNCRPALLTNRAASNNRPDPVGRQAREDEGLQQAFEAATYSLKTVGDGSYHAKNPAQRLELTFEAEDVQLRHPKGNLSVRLVGYGHGDHLLDPKRPVLSNKGGRLDYGRGDVAEWYVNDPHGLEHGFTFVRPPVQDSKGEPLIIVLRVDGSLIGAADSESIIFKSDRGVVLRYSGLKAVDALGRILPSWFEVRKSEIRLAVDDHDAQYPVVVDPTWTQQQELTASDGAADDYFGLYSAVNGNTAVIGAFWKNGFRGSAYVFVNNGGLWTQQQELTASNGAANDFFGSSVSVSGDTVVIGAPGKNGSRGAAYVFTRGAGVWTQQQELTASDGAANDQFGVSAAVHGNTAVMGASSKESLQGGAYIFTNNGGVWTQQQELTASDGAANDYFGGSVSLGTDVALIGASGKGVTNSQQGAAYVFANVGGVWSQQQELTASNSAANDAFGFSVSVSANTSAIGAPGKNGGLGAAYVFRNNGGVWAQEQELRASDGASGDNFGNSVSVSGNTAMVGAPNRDSYQGAVYTFTNNGEVWTQQDTFTPSDGATNGSFGFSVSVSGDIAISGAGTKTIGSNVDQGAAYAFVRPSLGTNTVLVGSAGGSSSVVLSYSSAWTATSNDSFLHVSPASANGTGNSVIVFSYDAFTGPGSRTGTLTIAGLTVTVTQAGTNYIGPGPVTSLVSGLNLPYGVAVDGAGNVYIADTFNNAVKEWRASTQQVNTLISSGLNNPLGLASDGSGNLYIADQGNNAIKEWNASTQQVTTILATGLNLPAAVALDTSGNIYIADTFNNAVKEWNATTQQVTTLASANQPWGVAVDISGNVYFSDTDANAVREWSSSSQQLSTLVSTGLSFPEGVAVDGSGNVFIIDTHNSQLKQWSASTQQVSTLISSGLNFPIAVAVDNSGNAYVADQNNNAIEMLPYAFVGPSTVTELAAAGSDSLLPVLPTTFPLTGIFAPSSDQSWLTAGPVVSGVVEFSFSANGGATRTANLSVLGHQIPVTQSAPLAQTITFGSLTNEILGVAPFILNASASSGLVVSFVTLTSSVCTISGNLVTLAGGGTCTIQATQAGNASYVAAAPVIQSFQVLMSQTITFSAVLSQVLGTPAITLNPTASSGLPVSVTSTTTTICTVSGDAVTLIAVGACVLQATQPGDANYAAAPIVNQSFQVTPPGLGAYSRLVGSSAGSASVILSCGGPWTATSNAPFLHVVAGSSSGTGSGLVFFTYDAFGGTGSRTGTLTIGGFTLTITQAGTNYIGPGPVTSLVSGLNLPYGVAVDGSGNVYIADTFNNAVKEWNAATQQVTTLISTGLNNPLGLAVDGSGNLYIADQGNNAIKQWSPSTQQVTTIVSTGLNLPAAVAVDAASDIYIADTFNNVVKLWSASTQQVTTVASAGHPWGIAVDISGNAYFADSDSAAIREWSPSSQQVTTLVSTGLNFPEGVAVDGSGNVFIVDTHVSQLKEWNAATQQLTTIISSGLNFPIAVAVDSSGNAYVADQNNNAIQMLPDAFVGPRNLTELPAAGSDSLPSVLPATFPLTGLFAPSSDQNWLTLGTIANGIINFAFTANTSASARVAHLSVVGQQLVVTQDGTATQPPSITSANSVTFTVGAAGSFNVTATGSPVPTLSESGPLPSGVTFNPSTSMLSGTPAAGTNGTYNITFTASNGVGANAIQTFSLTVSLPTVMSLVVSPATVAGGFSNSTGTVTLNAAAVGTAAQRMVLLSSSNPAATVPASVTVPAGGTSANFTVTSHTVTANILATISATLNGGSQSASLTVTPGPGTSTVVLNPSSVTGGITNSTGTVTLSAPAVGTAAQRTVTLSSDNTAAAAVPPSVTVPVGAASANFTVTSLAVAASATADISATLNSVTQSAALIVAPRPGVVSVILNPTSVLGGSANSTATVTLSAPAVGTAAQRTVALSSSDTSSATVPASVAVAAGSTTATFTVTSHVVSTAASPAITASLNGTSSAVLTVSGLAITSVTLTPASVTGGITNSTGTVTLSAPAVGTAAQRTVTLSSDNTTAATVPGSVTVPAGAMSANFTVTSLIVAASAAVKISATLNAVTQSALLTVTPRPGVVSVTLNPTSLLGGSANSTATVTLSAPAVGTAAQRTVALSSSDTSSATVPASIAIAAGSTTVTFPVTSHVVSTMASSTITGTLNGSSSAVLTVSPLMVTSVTLSPTSVVGGGANSTAIVSFNGPASGTAAQRKITLSSTNTTAGTVPASVTATTGATSVTFTVTSHAVSSTTATIISAGVNGGTQSSTLTVVP